MKRSIFYLLLSLCAGCKMSTKERIQQTKTLRDVKQAELKRLADSFIHVTVTADKLEAVIKQLEPLRTTVDSLDLIIDSLEGNERPYRKNWREPDSTGHYQ